MASKPTSYINWTSGSPPNVLKPPNSQQTSGWVAGEPPAAEYMNWLLWVIDQWIQYLDQLTAATEVVGPAAIANSRLINGGTWYFEAPGGTFSWSANANIAMPGAADSANQIAAGSQTLADGKIAYVQANLPFVTTGDVASGSNHILNVNYNQGIVVGQIINGSGIPAGATVSAISGNNVTMSANATATSTGAALSFCANTALTVSVATESSYVPKTNTMVIARRVGDIVIVGVGAGEMILRDGEAKQIREVGYDVTFTAIAGENLEQGDVAYISRGSANGDSGRTMGRAYQCDTSLVNGPQRANAAGMVISTTVTTGNPVVLLQNGVTTFWGGLSVGYTYYASNPTLEYPTADIPITPGTWSMPVGYALSATVMLINIAGAATIVSAKGTQGTYGVFTESQFSDAILACASAGGGVICLEAPITLTINYAPPPNTLILGQLDATTLTLSNSTLYFAAQTRMRDVTLAGSTAGQIMIDLTSNGGIVEGCRFIPSVSVFCCIFVTGNMNRMYNNTFVGVAGASPIGIVYQRGSGNLDESSLFF